MFSPELFTATPAHRRVYGRYELVYTTIDCVAALSFVIGSTFLFYDSLTHAGTWMFLIGSLCFAARPSVRFLREFHLARLPLPEDDPPTDDKG